MDGSRTDKRHINICEYNVSVFEDVLSTSTIDPLTMKYELPETTNEVIAQAQAEYTSGRESGNTQEERDAQHRLSWALVHAKDPLKVQLGLDMAEQLARIEGGEQREPEYYMAVGLYKLRRYLEARKKINWILEKWPGFRQGSDLKGLVEDAIVRDGLIGVGIGLGAAAVVGFGAVAAAFMTRR